MKSIYEKCENSVVVNGVKSVSFQTFREIRQGSVLSPVFFNIVMYKIRRSTEEKIVDYQTLWYTQATSLYGKGKRTTEKKILD
jgi:hypothetical protein